MVPFDPHSLWIKTVNDIVYILLEVVHTAMKAMVKWYVKTFSLNESTEKDRSIDNFQFDAGHFFDENDTYLVIEPEGFIPTSLKTAAMYAEILIP